MKIYTSYYGKKIGLENNIEYVATSRGIPKWYTGRSISELAPTREIKDMKVGEFEPYYEALIRGRKKEIIERLKAFTKKDIVLLCYEKNPAECHRSIAAKVLKEWGYEVIGEWGGDPSKKEKPKEPEEQGLLCF